MSANQTWRTASIPILTRQPCDRPKIESIAFSPCGGQLATLSSAGEVVVWDLASAQIFGEVEGGGSIAFSPDGALLATGWGQCACLYDTATWQRIRKFAGQQHPVNCVAFAPSGDVVAVGDYRRFILWDVAAGRVLVQIPAHDRVVQALTFSPDGKALASRSFDDITLWDTTTGRALCAVAGLQGPTCDGCFAPDGKSIVSGQDKTSLGRWTLEGTRRLVFRDPRARGYFLSARYSSDGASLASGGQDEMVHLWDPDTGALRVSLPGPVGWVRSIAFSPDGRLLAAAAGPRVHLWQHGAVSPRRRPSLAAGVAANRHTEQAPGVTSVNAFIDRLKAVRWFANVGRPQRRDVSVFRIHGWEEWPGPENGSVLEKGLRYQGWHDYLYAAIRTYGLREVEELWEQVRDMTVELARGAVPFDPEADAWVPTSQCVHDAAFCAALIACYLKMGWPSPAELVEDWRWYEAGHWPCGYGVL
jgi:hypothetical protein